MGEMLMGKFGIPRAVEVCRLLLAIVGVLLLFSFGGSLSRAQNPANDSEPYSRLNTWSIFGEFSPNSHHIFLGDSQERRIVSLGGEYARRLVFKRWFELDYLV